MDGVNLKLFEECVSHAFLSSFEIVIKLLPLLLLFLHPLHHLDNINKCNSKLQKLFQL